MKKIIIMGAAALLLTTVLTVAMLLAFPKKEAEAGQTEPTTTQAASETTPEVFPYTVTQPFISNLRESKKHVKASIIIELNNAEDLLILEKFDYIIKDTVLGVLRSLNETDIQDVNMHLDLKERIREELEKALSIESINQIFFTELVMQ